MFRIEFNIYKISLIALYYVCSVGIYYNVHRFKKHGATQDNKIIKLRRKSCQEKWLNIENDLCGIASLYYPALNPTCF
jgi:hypothetical protein